MQLLWVCNEQFGSIRSFVCRIRKFQLFPRTSGTLLFFSCWVRVFSPGGKFLQRIEQGLHNRSDLFWGILKDAEHLWAQGSPKTHWHSSVVQFKIELWDDFPLLQATQILVWEKPAVSLCLLEEKSCSVRHSRWRERTGLFCWQILFFFRCQNVRKSLPGSLRLHWDKVWGGERGVRSCRAAVPSAAPQCHLVRARPPGASADRAAPLGPRCARSPKVLLCAGALPLGGT